ncbi:uncharacterized protein LOC142173693 [Nicotiana tabacum]|uniref:Uncharacterized protein LOC142173693 n=1 Tax=Nicotiana tabacum TaxID=4097 RepID=A0AC58TDY7_TOBAC
MGIFQVHRQISNHSQGTNSVSVYFTILKDLWAEYDAMVPPPGCDCAKSKESIEHFHQQRLLQFLIGLSDSYDQARRQILLKSICPTINQAYAMIIEDESQHSVGLNAVTANTYSLAMQLTRGQPYKDKRRFLQCEYGNMKGHSMENYYKLTGYGKQPFNAVNNVTGNVDIPPPQMHYRNSGPTEVKAQYFTEEQYK